MKKHFPIIIFIATFSLALFFIFSQNTLAANSGGTTVQVEAPLKSAGAITGITKLLDILPYFANAINAILGIAGAATLLMIVYGGIILLSSHGNTQSVEKGKNILTWAIIGALVTAGSYVLVSFIIAGFLGTGTAPTTPPEAQAPVPSSPADSCETKYLSGQGSGGCRATTACTSPTPPGCTISATASSPPAYADYSGNCWDGTAGKCYTLTNNQWQADATKKCCYNQNEIRPRTE